GPAEFALLDQRAPRSVGGLLIEGGVLGGSAGGPGGSGGGVAAPPGGDERGGTGDVGAATGVVAGGGGDAVDHPQGQGDLGQRDLRAYPARRLGTVERAGDQLGEALVARVLHPARPDDELDEP